jgi:hypothetical protein
MPLDPVIAAGFKGVQLPDPVENYLRMQQMQQAQQQGQLNALKMQEYQRDVEQQNRLREFIPTLTPQNRSQLLSYGTPGRQAYESMIKGEKESREAEKATVDIAAARMKEARNLLPSVTTPEAYSNWRAYTLQNLPGLANIIPEQYSPETVRGLMLEADKALEQHFVTQNLGGEQQVIRVPKYGQGPAQVVPGSRVAEVPLPADVAAQRAGIASAGRTSNTVVMPPQEKAEQGERGKMLVKQYEGVSESAKVATRTLPALETQANVLDKGFKTGFGTDAQKVGASLLGALGVPEAAKFATDAQTFLGAAQAAVLQRQLEQKGPQTEADAQRISQTGAQLGNTPEANRFMIDVAKAQLKRDIEQRNFYDKWWKENKTYDGAEDAWFTGEGGKSLFDRADLKKYATPRPAAPAPAAAPSVPAYADADKERRYQEWKRKQAAQ